MVERFGLDKKKLNEIKKMDIPKQISEINKMLDGMGITQKTVDAMGDTTKGLFAQLGEKSRTFFKDIGMESNSKLADFLRRLNKMFDGLDTKSISDKLGSMLGKATDKAIALFNIFVKWRTEIAYAAGAIATFVAALAVVGTISALANPISLIAMGIAAAAVGFKALYDNSEGFRGVISGIIGAFKAVSTIFSKGLKGYGTARNLLESAGFSEDQVQSVISFSYKLKDAFDKVKSVFSGIGTLVTGGSSLNLLTALGFSPETATKVDGQINGIVSKISEFVTNVKSKFGEVREYIAEKISQMSPTFDRLKEIFSKAWDTLVDVLTGAWSIIEPFLSGFWNMLQVLGDVAMIVFNNVILPAISFLIQLFSTLWAIAQPILSLLAIGFEALSTVIKWLWDNILVPLVDFILSGVKNAFDALTGALEIVQGAFESLGGWISNVYGHIKDFFGFISSVKLPDWVTNGISTTVSTVGGWLGFDGGKKSHYSGLDSVPYDGYSARLHKGERVLTARENKEYSEGKSGNGSSAPVINIAKMEVRQDSDIEAIAYQLSKLIERQATQVG